MSIESQDSRISAALDNLTAVLSGVVQRLRGGTVERKSPEPFWGPERKPAALEGEGVDLLTLRAQQPRK